MGQDSSLFFSSTPEQIVVAKHICRSCPTSVTCLQAALDVMVSKAWGGATESARLEKCGIKPREALIQRAEASDVMEQLLCVESNYMARKNDGESRKFFR